MGVVVSSQHSVCCPFLFTLSCCFLSQDSVLHKWLQHELCPWAAQVWVPNGQFLPESLLLSGILPTASARACSSMGSPWTSSSKYPSAAVDPLWTAEVVNCGLPQVAGDSLPHHIPWCMQSCFSPFLLPTELIPPANTLP